MPFPSPPNRAEFAAHVYGVVAKIPAGRVMTYGQIAACLDRPRGVAVKTYSGLAARWVGAAMAHAPEYVPWQRVINSQGKVSVRPGGGGEEQQALLEAEGVEFDFRGRVDLARFGYVPRKRTASKKSRTRR